MRLEGQGDGTLRTSSGLETGSVGRAVPLPRGVYFKRICLCPSCGSESTQHEGGGRKAHRMVCRRCGVKFKAGEG